MVDLTQKTIGRYKIVELLGIGGMPIVYKAWDTRLERDIALTGTSMALGTPVYMAPEQWSGKTSPVSDVYTLGVVFMSC